MGTKDTFEGLDIFGNRIVAVAGSSGSFILTVVGDDDDGDGEPDKTVSVSAETAMRLGDWIKDCPDATRKAGE